MPAAPAAKGVAGFELPSAGAKMIQFKVCVCGRWDISGNEVEYELGSSTVLARDSHIHEQTQTDLDGPLSSCDFFFT